MFDRQRLCGVVVILALIVSNVARPEVSWGQDTRHYFLQKLGDVRPGMLRAEVDKLMSSYAKGTNWPYSPSPTMNLVGSRRRTYQLDSRERAQLTLKDCDVFRHSDEAQFDSDWGIVCYEHDRVSWIDFAPD